MLNIPNTLTILRVLLVPIFVISLLNRHFGWSLVIFVAAGVTDAIDGVIARIAHQKTTLGEYLDPIADKLLLTSAFVALAILKTIPSWLAVIVLTRDVIISLGFIILFLMDRRPEIRPTTFSKVNTVIQVLTIALALFSKMQASVAGIVSGMILAAAGTTILTGLQYIYLGTRMTNGTGKNTRG
ncbi:MAG: CDP-diacylglycerol--glycerol-3-phosphate 3-phosphatidyltransferase [Proteobacteria bacterium]|nr:CDP-diacylglycerol--glycerol-3-phosphate 3-phosphatidyltransferase [Pseudomonadota bacterium]